MNSALSGVRPFFIPFLGIIILCLSGCELSGGYSTNKNESTQAVALHVPPTPVNTPKAASSKVDYIVVQKQARLLSLWKDGRVLRTYSIMAMGANPVGSKVYEGDERTPEGQYYIDEKHVSQNFQKFLRISYPNKQDIQLAKRFGVPPGGYVGIHGDRGGMAGFFQRYDKNWTDGCLAIRNKDIEEVYSLVEVGTPILIKP